MSARHRRGTRSLAAELLGLLVPVECAGCGQWDATLCARCADLLRVPPARCDATARHADLPVWSVGPYAGPLRELVVAWKTHRRLDVAPAVLAAGRLAGRRLAEPLISYLPDGGRPLDVVVVPAPSGWRRRLARRLVARDLAGALARGLAAALRERPGHPVRRVLVADVLRRRRGRRAHQAGLGARRRAANRRAGVRALAVVPPDAVVLLVDDVLTTGATLAACVDALAGARVIGAFALVHAPASSLPARRASAP